MSVAELEEILIRALDLGASDVHIQSGNAPEVRLHGGLQPMDDGRVRNAGETAELLLSIASDKQRQEFDENWELDFSHAVAGRGRFRINYFYQSGGAQDGDRKMSAAFRSIPTKVPTLAEIEAPYALLQMARLDRGLILLTGPTGSGKSTTLAALIDVINRERPCHILTLEDPIEFVHEGKQALINQREVGRDSKSFAEGLRRALRQDPDVILVGEMRDLETMQIALTAAETGHLVLSTLHTQSANSTVTRVIDMFPAEQQNQIRAQLAASLKGVVTQALLPCLDGRSRVAAHEVMVINDAAANLIRTGKIGQLRTVLQTHAELGMQTMDKALMHLVSVGRVDLEVARQKQQDPTEFDSLVAAVQRHDEVQVPRVVTVNDLATSAEDAGRMHAVVESAQTGADSPSPAQAADVCPVHNVPRETLLLFDDAGNRQPPGTTHAVCGNVTPAVAGVDLPSGAMMTAGANTEDETDASGTDELELRPPTFRR